MKNHVNCVYVSMYVYAKLLLKIYYTYIYLHSVCIYYLLYKFLWACSIEQNIHFYIVKKIKIISH